MLPYANGDRNSTKSNIEQIEVNRLNSPVFYSEDDDDVLALKKTCLRVTKCWTSQ